MQRVLTYSQALLSIPGKKDSEILSESGGRVHCQAVKEKILQMFANAMQSPESNQENTAKQNMSSVQRRVPSSNVQVLFIFEVVLIVVFH